MKVYVVFRGSGYPYASGDVIGVFANKKDAEEMEKSEKSSESFIEEHILIFD